MTTLLTLTAYGIDDNKSGRGINRRLPTGRAWKGENITAVCKAVGAESRRQQLEINDTASIENMLFGDNLENWEECLGLISEGLVSERELAVTRKLSDIGGLKASDVERELQAAGFNLYVYENRFDPGTIDYTKYYSYFGDAEFGSDEFSEVLRYYSINPYVFKNNIPSISGFGESFFGESYFGYNSGGVGAELFARGSFDDDFLLWNSLLTASKIRYQYSFFIAGSAWGTIADVSADRRAELRRLIMEIKPMAMWAFGFINYV